VHHSEALRREPGGAALQEAVISGDVEALPLRLRALHTYALALTANPSAVQEADVHALLEAGLSERDVIDANQVGRLLQLRQPGRLGSGRAARWA
jgi:uncharacterized protein YciW